MMRKHFRFKSLILGFAFGLAMAAFSASAVRAAPTSGYGPLDPWAYALIHRSSSENIVPPDVRDHRLVAQLVAQGSSSDSYIGHPGGPGAAGPVLPEYDGVPLNRDLIGGPAGAGLVLSAPAQSTGDGFNWGDAGIGASVSFGAVLLLLTAVTLGWRYRRRIDPSGLATGAP